MSGGASVHALLERALVRMAKRAGIDAAIAATDWTRWASATFTGGRHEIRLAAPSSPALSRWVAALEEAEFTLPGHLVADLVVRSARAAPGVSSYALEIVTVEDVG
ncbi:MAG: hypothetical protein CVT77_11935 [Alphaproteobacteria bacterium HGW-Alphaproteobacteria-16]|nr:MAG: hypothetical protein CVT77_11935 [Alphaproteobacteria bacterium HGW-Alphaproteobacteria-16]